MRYAVVTGDEMTEFDPIVFVYNNGEYEVICESPRRQKSYTDHLASDRYKDFDSFLSTFSYFNVATGEVTPSVESKLESLRSTFDIP